MDTSRLSDTAKRIIWTFVEAFVAAAAVLAPGIFTAPNLENAKALGIAAVVAGIAAGVSAVKNLLAKPGTKLAAIR